MTKNTSTEEEDLLDAHLAGNLTAKETDEQYAALKLQSDREIDASWKKLANSPPNRRGQLIRIGSGLVAAAAGLLLVARVTTSDSLGMADSRANSTTRGITMPSSLEADAELAEQQGDLAKAVKLLQAAVEQREQVNGPAHPKTIQALDKLASAIVRASLIRDGALRNDGDVISARKTVLRLDPSRAAKLCANGDACNPEK